MVTAGSATKAASSIVSRVKKPTAAGAKAISQYFSAVPNREKKRPFNPLVDSVVESQKKKKKGAIPTHAKKAISVKRGKPKSMQFEQDL